jgi:glutamine synthetase type III
MYFYFNQQVVTIFGIFGACRTDELLKLLTSHVKFCDEMRLIIVDIIDTKTGVNRSFTISNEYFGIVSKYFRLRPAKVMTTRFFVQFEKGRCTAQVIGQHKFSKMPSDIAKYLGLPDYSRYTGTTGLFL